MDIRKHRFVPKMSTASRIISTKKDSARSRRVLNDIDLPEDDGNPFDELVEYIKGLPMRDLYIYKMQQDGPDAVMLVLDDMWDVGNDDADSPFETNIAELKDKIESHFPEMYVDYEFNDAYTVTMYIYMKGGYEEAYKVSGVTNRHIGITRTYDVDDEESAKKMLDDEFPEGVKDVEMRKVSESTELSMDDDKVLWELYDMLEEYMKGQDFVQRTLVFDEFPPTLECDTEFGKFIIDIAQGIPQEVDESMYEDMDDDDGDNLMIGELNDFIKGLPFVTKQSYCFSPEVGHQFDFTVEDGRRFFLGLSRIYI